MNIITAQPGGDRLLRVWGYPVSNGNNDTYTYDNIWTAEGIYHASVAIGDVDNDGKTTEIVAPTYDTFREGKGRAAKNSYREMFFNVYKDGVEGIWKRSKAFREDGSYSSNEIIIADVDGDSGNEVVMITSTQLVIYKWDGKEFNIENSIIPSAGGYTLVLESVTVGDIDGDGVNEILVSANVKGRDNMGYLLIFDYGTLGSPIFIDANLSDQSLRVGDVNGDGNLEICSTGYRKDGDVYKTFIFIWNSSGSLYEHPIFTEVKYEKFPWIHLDVGEVTSEWQGDEIVLGSLYPDRIILYDANANDTTFYLEEKMSVNPQGIHSGCSIGINNVYIADADGNEGNEIVACGFGRLPSDSTQKGRGKPPKVVNDFYLEVFDANLSSIWSRIGGDPDKDEYEVWYAAIGKAIGKKVLTN